MSILVYIENWEGKFKKASYETLSYASELAKQMGMEAITLSIGKVDESELSKLGNYGVAKIISVDEGDLSSLDNQIYSSVIANVAEKQNAKVVLLSHSFTGKALAPALSVKLKAGLVSGVMGLPESFEPFIVKKKAFTSKVIAHVKINTDVKILTLAPNSFEMNEAGGEAAIEKMNIDLSAKKTQVIEVNRITGKIILTDADIVVSGGRGMKSGDNWGPLEELAEVLGAATACSRPVSDEGWRPHSEHVGQTGKIVAPNLYFALGISGAIQHMAGVSSSKCIVAVNKDPEAPVFETSDYGIVGDVNKVLPILVEAAKEIKAG